VNELTVTYVVVCPKCGGLLLAQAEQKTRTCPYCGYNVALQKAKRIASARSANEASMILRRLKLEGMANKQG